MWHCNGNWLDLSYTWQSEPVSIFKHLSSIWHDFKRVYRTTAINQRKYCSSVFKDLLFCLTRNGCSFEPSIRYDLDFGGDTQDRKSMTEYIAYAGNDFVAWGAIKQSFVRLSNCEAKYCTLSISGLKAVWMGSWIMKIEFEVEKRTNIKKLLKTKVVWRNREMWNKRWHTLLSMTKSWNHSPNSNAKSSTYTRCTPVVGAWLLIQVPLLSSYANYFGSNMSFIRMRHSCRSRLHPCKVQLPSCGRWLQCFIVSRHRQQNSTPSEECELHALFFLKSAAFTQKPAATFQCQHSAF